MSAREEPWPADPGLWDWMIRNLGCKLPCSLCKVPTPPAELTECLVPSTLAFADCTLMAPIVVRSAIWVCPRCPRW
jgi:hypothetical protein